MDTPPWSGDVSAWGLPTSATQEVLSALFSLGTSSSNHCISDLGLRTSLPAVLDSFVHPKQIDVGCVQHGPEEKHGGKGTLGGMLVDLDRICNNMLHLRQRPINLENQLQKSPR